eukprot:1757030-Ditylum_brightwellii.AAC.1
MARKIMTLAVILGLKSRQVDYTNAFVQASLLPNKEVYMNYPQGWEKKNKVLKLTSSVYGLSQAPLAWFNKLSQGLKDAGFKPSTLDPCLFFSDDVICVVYADDCLMFARDINMVDKAIDKMKELGFQLHVEDDGAGFLGIKLEHQDDGSIEMKQDALIERIIETVGFKNAKGKPTPAEVAELTVDPLGPGTQENWFYALVVGMLIYLAPNSWPDIAMT